MSTTFRCFFVTALVSFVFACGGTASSPARPGEPSRTATADPSCPVTVPGTSAAVEDTETGAALVFVTTGDVSELRRRVAAMAAMHNDHHGKMGTLPTGEGPAGGGPEGHEMGGMDHAKMGGMDHAKMSGMDHAAGGEHADHAGGMISIHSKATAEDIDAGARLIFTAAPADVAALGDQLRMHAQHMAAGTCAMEGH